MINKKYHNDNYMHRLNCQRKMEEEHPLESKNG